ncbi:MAG: phosphatase PAP2 family protein [Candidatus Marinimicrobia bacterium]|nr:phosphatase PAP2 family protein [Candidatus Neomarinimicrobiota bacterium]
MIPKNKTNLTNPKLETPENLFWFYVPIVVSAALLTMIWLFRWNVNLFYSINHVSGITGTHIWQVFTIFGDGLISALLIAFWIRKKPEIAWSFLLATLFYMIILNMLKDYFDFKRPPALLAPETFFLAGKAYMKRSFPSGHTTTIFAFCGVISFYYKSLKIRLLTLTLALMVGLSRVLIGVHWPADILGGAILGWSSAGIGIFMAKRSTWGYHKIVKYSLSLLLALAAGLLVFKYNTGYQDAEMVQKILGIIIIGYLGFTYFVRDRIKMI